MKIQIRCLNYKYKTMDYINDLYFFEEQMISELDDNNEADSIEGRVKLMLSTGLEDKNDNEIYEGDILNDELVSFKIIFRNGCFYGKGINYTKMRLLSDILLTKSFEIIGNIYENPELLEVKK